MRCSLIQSLLPIAISTLLGGRVPAGLISFLADLIPAVVETVQDLNEDANSGVSGPEKAKAAVETLAEFIEEDLDDIPEWSELGEEKRDIILNGLVELAYFVIDVQSRRGRRGARRVLRKASRKIRNG